MLKQTISVRSELELLQMVLQLGTERCASKDIVPQRGVDCEIPHQLERRTSANEDVGLQGWTVRSHIGWREE